MDLSESLYIVVPAQNEAPLATPIMFFNAIYKNEVHGLYKSNV